MRKSAALSNIAAMTMSPDGHAAALAARHAELEMKLAREAARPLPDRTMIAHLKKMKLHIKDRLFGR